MTSIKYDFNSCYDAYNFLQFDNEQVTPEYESSELNETVEDILKILFVHCGIEAPNKLYNIDRLLLYPL